MHMLSLYCWYFLHVSIPSPSLPLPVCLSRPSLHAPPVRRVVTMPPPPCRTAVSDTSALDRLTMTADGWGEGTVTNRRNASASPAPTGTWDIAFSGTTVRGNRQVERVGSDAALEGEEMLKYVVARGRLFLFRTVCMWSVMM